MTKQEKKVPTSSHVEISAFLEAFFVRQQKKLSSRLQRRSLAAWGEEDTSGSPQEQSRSKAMEYPISPCLNRKYVFNPGLFSNCYLRFTYLRVSSRRWDFSKFPRWNCQSMPESASSGGSQETTEKVMQKIWKNPCVQRLRLFVHFKNLKWTTKKTNKLNIEKIIGRSHKNIQQ